MPVDGYHHKRVWQYTFRPQPYQVLDRGWHGHDKDWELGVIERLRRGEAAPRAAGNVYDLFPDAHGDGAGGWEEAEERSKKAIRTNAAYLNDQAIARRLPERELRKRGWEETRAEWKVRMAEQNARRDAMESARAEAHKAWMESAAERQRLRVERDAAWTRRNEETEILNSRWECPCGTRAVLTPQDDGYRFDCPACGKTAFGKHEVVLRAKIT